MSIFVSPRIWFAVQAAVYVALALPLTAAPTAFLSLLGWSTIDPTVSRLFGAALFAMGMQSYAGRRGDEHTCRRLLNFDLVWAGVGSLSALVAIGAGAPEPTWWVLGLLIAVLGIAGHYRVRLKQFAAAEPDPVK